jgi:hypothetical protein
MVSGVHDGLSPVRPTRLGYVTFRAPDGVNVVYVAVVEPRQGPHGLSGPASFGRLAGGAGERLEETPRREELTAAGSYGCLPGGGPA